MKTRISVVSYLNAQPFYRGLIEYGGNDLFEITTDIPSVCAEKLKSNIVDIGLIPVAEIKHITNAEIITNYCIAGLGKVGSVLILCNQPLEEISTIYLDNESRTSVKLAKVLSQYFWKREFIWEQEKNNIDDISAKEAVLIIGDRALKYREQFKYQYDLSECWYQFTSLPFVFACWVTTKQLSEAEIKLLNKCFSAGINNRNEIAKEYNTLNCSISTNAYFTEFIRYELKEREQLGLEKFLSLI